MEKNESFLKNDLPWLIFSICGLTYAINSQYVTGILVPPDNLTPVPEAPEEYRGIVNIRGEVYPVIDMRTMFNYPSIDKECEYYSEVLTEREKDHINWVNELKRCVAENCEFKLTTDPHKCKFGVWFDEFKNNPANAGYSLLKIDEPHTSLHHAADELATLRKMPDSSKKDSRIREIMKLVNEDYLPEISSIMNDFKTRYKGYFRETMVTFNSGAGNSAIMVDKVLAIDKITPVSGRTNMDRIFRSPFFIGVARSSRVDSDILVIDDMKIIEKTKRDIPDKD